MNEFNNLSYNKYFLFIFNPIKPKPKLIQLKLINFFSAIYQSDTWKYINEKGEVIIAFTKVMNYFYIELNNQYYLKNNLKNLLNKYYMIAEWYKIYIFKNVYVNEWIIRIEFSKEYLLYLDLWKNNWIHYW